MILPLGPAHQREQIFLVSEQRLGFSRISIIQSHTSGTFVIPKCWLSSSLLGFLVLKRQLWDLRDSSPGAESQAVSQPYWSRICIWHRAWGIWMHAEIWTALLLGAICESVYFPTGQSRGFSHHCQGTYRCTPQLLVLHTIPVTKITLQGVLLGRLARGSHLAGWGLGQESVFHYIHQVILGLKHLWVTFAPPSFPLGDPNSIGSDEVLIKQRFLWLTWAC